MKLELQMRLARILDKITSVLFGEKSFRMQAHWIPQSQGVANYSCGRSQSYRVKWRSNRVFIEPRNSWNFLTGSSYLFKGAYRQVDGKIELSGRVLVTPLVKTFFLIWMGLVLLIWIAAIGVASYTMLEFLIDLQLEPDKSALRPPDASTHDRLSGIGAMVGLGPILIASAIGMIGFNRMIKRAERRRLIEFCRRFAASNPDL